MPETFDHTPRNDGGVKYRLDGGGDAWGNAHRDGLGREFYLQDIDAAFGIVVFGQNTSDRLFLEYVPDNFVNRENVIRRFAVVAMFDRKTNREAAFARHSVLSRAFYLWQCRLFESQQPVAPRFFVVVGAQQPPWVMLEIDINNGAQTGAPTSIHGGAADWRYVWDTLGLTSLRNELVGWIQ